MSCFRVEGDFDGIFVRTICLTLSCIGDVPQCHGRYIAIQSLILVRGMGTAVVKK